jgi:hypothetical protein
MFALGIEFSSVEAKGTGWSVRLRCDACGRSAARINAIVAWDGNAPITDAHYKIRSTDPVLLCRFECQDRFLEENPAFKLRSMSFRDFITNLARDILPGAANDPTHECRLRIELYLSARPNEFVPQKTLHAAIPYSVRQSGAWNTALNEMLNEGRLQIRRTKTNPRAARALTEYRLLVGNPSVN